MTTSNGLSVMREAGFVDADMRSRPTMRLGPIALVQLDHCFYRGVSAVAWPLDMPGSDHRPLWAMVV